MLVFFFFFSSRRRHTRLQGDWSSDVCSSDLRQPILFGFAAGQELSAHTAPFPAMLNQPGKWVGPVGQAKAIQRRQPPPRRDLEDRAISVGAAVLGSPVKVPVGTLDEGRLGIGADPIEIRKSRESLRRRRNRPRTEQKGRAEPLHLANSAHIVLLAALIFGHVDYT